MAAKSDHTTTKAEETKTLRDFAALQGKNSYLGMLFTPAMLDWAEQVIHDDGNLDLYGYYQESVKDALDLSNQNNRQAIIHGQEVADLQKQVAADRTLLAQVQADDARAHNNLVNALAETRADLEAERQRYVAEAKRAGDLEWQLTVLKARLLDTQDDLAQANTALSRE